MARAPSDITMDYLSTVLEKKAEGDFSDKVRKVSTDAFDKLRKLSKDHPEVLGALIGAAGGSLLAGKGSRVMGGLLGGGVGAVGGNLLYGDQTTKAKKKDLGEQLARLQANTPKVKTVDPNKSKWTRFVDAMTQPASGLQIDTPDDDEEFEKLYARTQRVGSKRDQTLPNIPVVNALFPDAWRAYMATADTAHKRTTGTLATAVAAILGKAAWRDKVGPYMKQPVGVRWPKFLKGKGATVGKGVNQAGAGLRTVQSPITPVQATGLGATTGAQAQGAAKGAATLASKLKAKVGTPLSKIPRKASTGASAGASAATGAAPNLGIEQYVRTATRQLGRKGRLVVAQMQRVGENTLTWKINYKYLTNQLSQSIPDATVRDEVIRILLKI